MIKALEKHLNHRCKRKVRYGHLETAEKAAVAMEKKKKHLEEFEVYTCEVCGGYHIGHVGVETTLFVLEVKICTGE